MTRPRKRLPAEPVEVLIESFSHDGRGVAHLDGKAVFVHGALPGERVLMRVTRRARRHDEAVVTEVLAPVPERVAPRCAHFGVCGGCALQHLDPAAQATMKQQVLDDALTRLGKVTPTRWLPPLVGTPWGYRHKARLGVRWVAPKGRVLVGFRERGSGFVADTGLCPVLTPAVGERIEALARLVERLSIREQVPQIEVAQGDGPAVLVLRVLAAPSAADLGQLQTFAEATGLYIHLQDGGPDSVRPLPGHGIDLHYGLPRHGVRIGFAPGDFTQVNPEINRLMVDQALDLLDPQPDETVLDLFCGVGNFTLPIARRAAAVVGVEGDAGLVERARQNALANAIGNASFHATDLYGALDDAAWTRAPYHKALIDPPRTGAWEVLDLLGASAITRLVYVSCYPGTLARDAAQLVGAHGFELSAAGVMDMFPHTAHLESMAVFDRG